MIEKKQQTFSQEGYDKIVEELNYLKTTRRQEILSDIATARGFGDLSENAEYDEARTEQAKIEARIIELEAIIENAIIVDSSKIDETIVNIGSVVTVLDEQTGVQSIYTIVGSNEANAKLGKISDVSPKGQALVGHRAGTTVEFETPKGLRKLKIVSVARNS